MTGASARAAPSKAWPGGVAYYAPRERAALALTEAVTLIAHGVPDNVYAEAERHFEPAELAALIWHIVAINAWNRLAIPTGDPVPGTYEPG